MRLLCFKLAASMDAAALSWECSGMHITKVTRETAMGKSCLLTLEH